MINVLYAVMLTILVFTINLFITRDICVVRFISV